MIMALLDRVTTLMRANLNDLIDKAEDPEKMVKQVILDIQNQLLQLKTQMAIAIADQHLLVKKKQENAALSADWVRKAEFAVDKKQEDLARAALEKSLLFGRASASFAEQVQDQTAQVETLKSSLLKLQVKLAETQTHADVLIAQHRRSKVLKNSRPKVEAIGDSGALQRMKSKVQRTEAEGLARYEMAADSLEDKLSAIERDDEVEKLLHELRDRRATA